MTLTQPGADTFDLFHSCCLLHKGQVLYFGPVSEVKDFLLSVGFVYDKNKTLPQWLEEICANPMLHGPPANFAISKYRESDHFRKVSQEVCGVTNEAYPEHNVCEGKKMDMSVFFRTGKVTYSNKRRNWFTKVNLFCTFLTELLMLVQ